ncbi:MAG: hypothetical protein F4Z25_08795 [Chloroflexi bacterium]|nr:hypothetical protein [Chloroflexota bacterium]MYE46064.1 hypothetical protein [Chloroflexota bacterium]
MATAAQTGNDVQTSATSRVACVHHWVIESPSGRRESAGVCKRCGLTRNFANATENVMWEQTNTLSATPISGLRHLPRPDHSLLSDELVVD